MKQVIKKRQFLLVGTAPDQEIESAVAKLQHYPGISDTSHSAGRLVVEYDLANWDYASLRNKLNELLPLAEEHGFNKLKSDWNQFLDTNERSHSSMSAGWSHHLQDLYLSTYPKDRTQNR